VRAIGAILAVFAMDNAAPVQKNDTRAAQIVESTRTTQSNFVVISEIFVDIENISPKNFVGGEFHSGALHRMEDANNRVVADCSKREGHQLWLPKMQRNDGVEVAIGACGIGPTTATAALKYVGRVTYKFGIADRVQIADNGFVRTYDVLSNGAIVRNIWIMQRDPQRVIYKSNVISYCAKAMPPSSFDRSSLYESYLAKACT
jgi:hypothetical protein